MEGKERLSHHPSLSCSTRFSCVACALSPRGFLPKDANVLDWVWWWIWSASQCSTIALFTAMFFLPLAVSSSTIVFDSLVLQLLFSWVGSVDQLSPVPVGYSSFFFLFFFCGPVFVFWGCKMSFEVCWSRATALNPADRWEKRTGIMGDEEKALPCQITNWKSGRKELECCAVVGLFLWTDR